MLQELMRKVVNKKITNKGKVVLTIAAHEFEKEDVFDNAEFSDETITTVLVYGAEIRKDRDTTNFKQAVRFASFAKEDAMKIIDKKKQKIMKKIDREETNQKYLSKIFKDSTLIEALEKKLEDLEWERQNVVISEVFDTEPYPTMVVTCGRKIMYCPIDRSMYDDDIYSENKFKEINIDFSPEVEISKVWSTSIPHHIQIIAKDASKKVVIVATWDIERNIEASMF
jgi:hypothetical protein